MRAAHETLPTQLTAPPESPGRIAEGATPPVQIGMIGLGYWGPNLLRNLGELANAEIRYACDLDPNALAAIGRRYPGIRLTTERLELLQDPEVEAVVIATPASSHFSLAREALQAGKHVFVEKPLATSSAMAGELIRLAAAGGLVLMPGHTFLYSPPVNAIKDLIDSQQLGEIYFITSSRVNLGLHQPDASVIWDLGPHDFAIIRYWLGENPDTVSALSRSCIIPGVPDVAFVNLRFPAGTIAHIELAWLAPSKLRRTAIVGSRRMVVYDDMSREPVRIFDAGVMPPDPETFGEFKLTYRTGDIVSPSIEAREPLTLEMQDFCRCIRESATPRSSADLGLEVVRIAEAVDLALRLRSEVPLGRSAPSPQQHSFPPEPE